MILLAPIAPASSGNGLAMRCELFRRAAALDFELQSVIVPLAPGTGMAGAIEMAPDAAQARAGSRMLLAQPTWRERLAAAGRLPRAARAASPGLVDAIARALGERRFEALHVMRSYMAPLGVALAERLDVGARTLDLDDDDVSVFASALHDRAEASAYARLLEVFAPLYGGRSAASARDARAIAERLELEVQHVPNAVAIPRAVRRRAASELRLLFVGNLTYPPNVQAARVLVNEVLPRLSRLLGQRPVCLALAGHADAQVHCLASASVRVLGYVEDLEPLYADADAVVAALGDGGGTRIKLLEAFAHGVPVVATPAAAEGLAVIDGRHLLLGGDPAALAARAAQLARDPRLSAELVEQAWRLVRERYSQAAVIPRVRAFLAGAHAAGASRQPVLSP